MVQASLWLIKLILSHLLTDFMLQPNKWIQERKEKHFGSVRLYLHGLLTGILVWVFIGWQYWAVALVIMTSHILIDGWKSYREENFFYFLIDQVFHFMIIFSCWLFVFFNWTDVIDRWHAINANETFWKITTGIIFLTMPAAFFIGKMTKRWREKMADAESLDNAGKWIGIAERLIILIFVLNNQYSAIGLLVAAKGIIRFNEKDRQEIKTEYLVIGTLLSILIAIVTALIIKQ
jgi:Protein of unknown function (DUF3307)